MAALAAPAAAAGDPPSSGGAQAPPPPLTESVFSAQGPQVSLTARAGTMLRKLARFRGRASASEAGRTVAIERFDDDAQAWSVVARATVAADGSYLARWRGDRTGEHRVRAVLASPGLAIAATATPELAVTVHRPAVATWYGPGLYGNRTACGQRMSRQAARRRPQDAPLRDEGRRALQRPPHHRAGRRPRPVPPRHDLGPHRRHRPRAALRVHRPRGRGSLEEP